MNADDKAWFRLVAESAGKDFASIHERLDTIESKLNEIEKLFNLRLVPQPPKDK